MHDFTAQLATVMPTALEGRVARLVGTTAAVAGFPAPVGALAEIRRQAGEPLSAEVIGFRDDLTLLYPLGDLSGVRHGDRVRLRHTTHWLPVGSPLLGRVVDALGRPIDAGLPLRLSHSVPLRRRPPRAVERPRIDAALSTGVRAIDGLLTCGKGQRLGIFSGSGVGKSVLLGMMSRYTAADVNVIGLIGERGREVNDFIERDLGPEGLARSVVVVATSDEPALIRTRAAETATAIAEYFRDEGKDVLLLMDSVTRFALAGREIGLAAGEPPTTRGYPPSVFAALPKLVERAGRSPQGTITGFYSVLVEGDDPNEPIADCVRGLLDGHIWLSRKLATRGHYPAIDLLQSISRLMSDLATPQQIAAATTVRQLLSAYNDNEDLISIGAYRPGTNSTVDLALAARDEIRRFLQQNVAEGSSVDTARAALLQMTAKWTKVTSRMPKFTFRLDSLLRLRCSQRDERRAELAQAFRAEEILRRQREQIAGELAETRQQRAVAAGTLNVDGLLDAARHEFLLSSQQKLLEDQSVQVSAEIERRRQTLVAADQQVRVLEKLKETQLERHRAQEQTHEQNRLDEVAQRPAKHDVTVDSP